MVKILDGDYDSLKHISRAAKSLDLSGDLLEI